MGKKGNGGELEVAGLLQAWWRKVEPECIFKRTPNSGGWSNGQARGAFRVSGDIVTDAKKFPFSVEVKRRETFASRYIDGRPSEVWTWWRQTQRQAAEVNGLPMLWFRKNREPWRVIIPDFYWWMTCERIPAADRQLGITTFDQRALDADFGVEMPLQINDGERLLEFPASWFAK